MFRMVSEMFQNMGWWWSSIFCLHEMLVSFEEFNSIQFQFHSWCQSHWAVTLVWEATMFIWMKCLRPQHPIHNGETIRVDQAREAEKTKCSIESKVKIKTRVFSILWYNYRGEPSTRGISQIWLQVREESKFF
jgi:hypothetical protein